MVLRTLFINTSGASWTNSSGWLTEAPLDDWYGVMADERDRVTALDLPDNWLQNEIPGELGGLKRLVRLDLSENSFFGRDARLPSEFANLESLERLDLRDADLHGKLPVQLGELRNLKRLDISHNWMEGEIPREWMNLDLEYFHWKPILDSVDLCAPADAAFQAWLNSIPDHEGGKTCGG